MFLKLATLQKKKKKFFLASNNHCEQLTAIALGADET